MGPFFLQTRPVDVGGQTRWEPRRGTSQAGSTLGVGKWSEKGGTIENWREKSETMGKTSEKMVKPSEFGD